MATPLPDRFPCWCRATYSWGGESKHDLGFVEGDLIECLNAGDGSWWMGRLRRNKQTGLFPSNFVQVLDASFTPVSRGSSPNVAGPSIIDSPKKSKTFRKPFQSYSSGPYAPPSQQAESSAALQPISRTNSWHQPAAPDAQNYSMWRDQSEVAPDETPPPAPPPHRSTFQRPVSALRSPPRSPRTPNASGMTPSPLRDAMNGVMSSLEDMQLKPEEPAEVDPWSPEAFEELQSSRPRRHRGKSRHTLAGTAFEATAFHIPPISHDETQFDAVRSHSSHDDHGPDGVPEDPNRRIRARRSAYELGRSMLDRTFSQRTSATSSSNGVSVSSHSTNHSLLSTSSAGKFSATSAGSLAKRRFNQNMTEPRPTSSHFPLHSQSSASSSHSHPTSNTSQSSHQSSSGLRSRRSGFFRKLVDSAKAGAASSRSTIADGRVEQQRPKSQSSNRPLVSRENEWMQVRRDINRSNSLSENERLERRDRCEMLGFPTFAAIETLDEAADGSPVEDDSVDYQSVNLSLVDKSARFVNSLPPVTNAASLAQGFLCRPYKSDVQRLRAIFTWTAEKIGWEEDFEGEVDTRRVIQLRRGSAKEVALLVDEMCAAVGLHGEIVPGMLKRPEDMLETRCSPNHWWNAVLVDDRWRMLDCSLAHPSHPLRVHYSSVAQAEFGLFLARPSDWCYSHVPTYPEQQHLCPPVAAEALMALPCASPAFFRHSLSMVDFDTSLLHIDNLEIVQISFVAPPDIECAAEVQVKAYSRDADGDLFESGEHTIIRALAQADWIGGQKQYTIKAHLPADEGAGVLRVYAGKRGLMHSIRDIPHPLAFSVPITHSGQNPPFEFFLRHPTPHALRHDLYVSQPQCRQLAFNNTFVFTVRQHACSSAAERPVSPNPLSRPSSAMSMTSDAGSETGKPAKLAMQSPSGKIMRMVKKTEQGRVADGSSWETIIKIGERGTWRGLVLADRSARWCVFGEWECP